MRRVAVIGGSCSGKTTLSRQLAARLGVPHVELDALHHDAGWQEAPADVLRERVARALEAAPEGWVVDGNYHGKIGDLVIARADTIVFLDLPYRTAVRRVVRRTVVRSLRGTELWNGNRETFRNAFSRESIVLWVLRTHRGQRAKWLPRLAGRNVVHLRSARAVRAWLASLDHAAGNP